MSQYIQGDAISIHAPRAGCDELIYKAVKTLEYFNPRTPCGVRLKHFLEDICI